MTIVIKGRKSTEVVLSPIYPETNVTLRRRSKHTVIYENDELIDILDAVTYPIMRIVRAIRVVNPNAKLEVI